MTAISQDVAGASSIATHRLKDSARGRGAHLLPLFSHHSAARRSGQRRQPLSDLAPLGRRHPLRDRLRRPIRPAGLRRASARPDLAAARVGTPSASGAFVTRYIAAVGIVILFVFPFAVFWLLGAGGSLKWIDNYGVQILIYVMLGWGLNIVVGLAGLLDLGYVAFYAVGAYSYALLATTFGLSFLDLPAARGHSRGAVGNDPRLSRAAPARRLSRDRHAGVRRNHPVDPHQLGRLLRRICRHRVDPAHHVLSACRCATSRETSRISSTSNIRRST